LGPILDVSKARIFPDLAIVSLYGQMIFGWAFPIFGWVKYAS
jgi:hypothetical protein